jgi:D-alanyl-lipoteichoic acid acyltransferase DltB (MBOAT superfamily)
MSPAEVSVALRELLAQLVRFDAKQPLLFTGGQFLFWFSVFYPCLLLLRRTGTARLGLIALFSCFFFYKCSGVLLGALLLTASADFLIAQRIAESTSPRGRRAWLWLSIALSGGTLVYFKYANLLLGGVSGLLAGHFEPLDLVAPAGISFYTFETVSYVVDVYRGRLQPTRRFLEYLAYLAYFPHLMAGPIIRAEQLLPALRATPELSRERLGSGLFLILSGLFKKAVVADYLARFSDTVFSGGTGLSGFELLLGVYGYAFQIYCDFAGYSEMALGLGRLTGVELPVNFRAPYAATSITEFWRRWHITLSTWLRDYIYIPLGGNRRGPLRTTLNLIVTMLFGGLWHGASLSFVLWGLLHGAALCVEKALARPLERWRALPAGRVLCCIVTFHLVLLLWIPFRAGSLSLSSDLISRIATDFQPEGVLEVLRARRPLLLALAVGALLAVTRHETLERLARGFARAPIPLRAAAALATIQLAIQLRNAETPPFIYFQF